ncbi:TetR/AcrR family transcriptional regulator [Vibrio sp. HN007]|uniref:TetR/AcrR family transcriptional regulator n=1 Tax=Vibrio iocasae TaxID=3098914 RepID=UPI0035D4DBDC
MGKIEQKKELKRQTILAAAQEVFLSEGYELASMDKIASLAQMTKQTLYRYFPSKIELFQATLEKMGGDIDESFLTYLQNPAPKEALLGFAKAFIAFHLSEEHIATYRLLVTEGKKAPEIVDCFMSAGPNSTDEKLTQFFRERLDIDDCESVIDLWTGMLLSIRAGVLIGKVHPTQEQIEQHAVNATEFLLAAIK